MFVKDWKMLTLISYTAWAFYALVFVTIAPDVIYSLFGIDTNPVIWGRLSVMICVLGLVGRLLEQGERGKWRRRAVIALILAVVTIFAYPAAAQSQDSDSVAVDLIGRWEGKENRSYQDIVGVWTICYGHTRTAAPGQYKTNAQCEALLAGEIREYRAGLYAYFTAETINSRLTLKRDAAYTSLAYNVGIRAAGKSTATRRLNRGNIKGGCHALAWWNKAGGRVVRGLVNRRSAEREYCLEGLK